MPLAGLIYLGAGMAPFQMPVILHRHLGRLPVGQFPDDIAALGIYNVGRLHH